MTTGDDPTAPKTYRCRAGTETQRCSYRGTRDELSDHAEEMGHPRCIICGTTLGWHEQQTCDRDIACVRDDLTGIETAFARLERRIGEAAYHGIDWNAVAMSGDGAITGGGEDDHTRYRDPLPPVAVIEAHDRDWRETFGHKINYLPLGHPDRHPAAVLADCISYLRTWHLVAARTHPGFDDYATEIRELRVTVEHVAGLADDPARGAPCACGTTLRRAYGQDDWTCPNCGTVVNRAQYLWRLRLSVHLPGWVSVAEAAKAVDRPMRTVQTWARNIDVPVVCIRLTRRVVVELASVQEYSETVPRVEHRSA